MNKLNTNYSSLTIKYKVNEKDILAKIMNGIYNILFTQKTIDILLKSLNIKFEKIKRLTCDYINFNHKNAGENIKGYFKMVLSCFINTNNLIYLNLKTLGNKEDIDIINKIDSLKILKLDGFKIPTNLILPNLEKISLYNCKNISFNIMIWKNIKYLHLYNTSIQTFRIMKFRNLITLKIDIDPYKGFNKVIDFSSLEKIENYYGYKYYLLDFNKTKLKNVDILSYLDEKIDINSNIQVIEKIISLKTLKSVRLELVKTGKDYITNIKGENNSVSDLVIVWNHHDSDCILYNLQKKFPNLSSITFMNKGKHTKFESPILEISENKNCKVDKINIILYEFNKSIKLYCHSFETLIELKIDFSYFVSNKICLEKFFGIFDKNCKIIFGSLKKFSYKDNFSDKKTFDDINKINFNCMPNLIDLTLVCTRKEPIFINYKKIIEKLLLLNIKNIKMNISRYGKTFYPLNKLREFFPNIKLYKFQTVLIEKYYEPSKY